MIKILGGDSKPFLTKKGQEFLVLSTPHKDLNLKG
jgi:hypothetical protein